MGAEDEPYHPDSVDTPPRHDGCHGTRDTSGSQMHIREDSEVFLNPWHLNEPPLGDRLVNMRPYEDIRTPGHRTSLFKKTKFGCQIWFFNRGGYF